MTDVHRSYWSIFVDPDIPLGERVGLAALFPVLGPLSLTGCASPAEPDTARPLSDPPRLLPDAVAHGDSTGPSADGVASNDRYCPPGECAGVTLPSSSATASRCLAFAEVHAAVGLNTSGVHRDLSIIDINHDEWPDVYVLNTDSANQLYRNEEGTGFVESAAQYGLAMTAKSRGAAWSDYDNDGDADLFLVAESGSQLYRRDADTFGATDFIDASPGTAATWVGADLLLTTTDGTRYYRQLGTDQFVDMAEDVGVLDPHEGAALATADYDGDGHTDIFLANVTGPNRLFRNLGNGTFASVEDGAGVAGAPLIASLAAAWIVWPGDILPSLYVANWDSANFFYRNNGDGTFTDQAEIFGLRDPGNTVVAAWSEPFGLALPSLFLGRWEQQNLFYVADTTPFPDLSIPLGLAATDQTVAAAWFDYDRDDRADLVVATTGGLQLHHNATQEVTVCR